MKSKNSVFTALAIFLSSQHAYAVTNGKPIRGESVGYAIGQIHLDSTVSCSGVLIAPQIVLTASHCFDQHITKHVEVIFDNYASEERSRYAQFITSTETQFDTSKIESSRSDFAIGILDEPIDAKFAHPMSLDLRPVKRGDQVEIAGTGQLSTKDYEFVEQLLLSGASRETYDDYKNSLIWGGETVVDQLKYGLIFTATSDRAAGKEGDSGSPLLSSTSDNQHTGWVVKGIMSRGGDMIEKGQNLNINWISPIASEEFLTFIHKIQSNYHLNICGLNLNCT